MRDVLQYFDLIAKIIEQSLAVCPELDLEQLDHKRGTVEGTLYFADGSRLEFTERIVIESARPVKRDRKSVFRYDNAPHHPQLPGFPHHKHSGRKTIAAPEPSLKDVLQEIEELLTTGAPSSPMEPTRKSRPRAKGKKQR